MTQDNSTAQLLVDELANELRHYRHSPMSSGALAEHILAIPRIHDALTRALLGGLYEACDGFPVSQDAAQLVERARELALSGEGSPDDLGGDIVTMSLRNPDGPALLEIIEALTRPQPSTSSVEAVARAELLEWASQHSNVTPLDGTDRDSPTFGDLRAALAPPTAQSGDRT